MPTIINKQRVLSQIFALLKKRYEPPEPEARTVFEQLLYSVCREGATPEQADRAFRALQDRFFDWNEIRVSSPREVEEAFAELSHPDARAQRLIGLLQEVFETTFSFDLEALLKKGMKQAAKQIARYQAANDYTVAWVTQRSLEGHAIPLDAPTLRALKRLGLIDDENEDPETLRGSLEHLVPKIRGPLFTDLMSALADELCHEDEPACGSCPLRGDCAYGQDATREATPSSRSNRPKPR
jgi:endonuclease-3